MSIAVDTARKSQTTHQAGVTSLTWSHTVAVGSFKLLCVFISWENFTSARFVTNVTYNGVALEFCGNAASYSNVATNTYLGSQIWFMREPPVGTGTIVVTFGGAVSAFAGAVVLTGVEQSDPLDCEAVTYTSGSVSPVSASVPSVPGDLVLDVITVDDAPALTVGGGQTQLFNSAIGGVTAGGASFELAVAPPVPMTWTLGSNDVWIVYAVAAHEAPPLVALAVTDDGRITLTEPENTQLGFQSPETAVVASAEAVAIQAALLNTFQVNDTLAVAFSDQPSSILRPYGIPLHLTEQVTIVTGGAVLLAVSDTLPLPATEVSTPLNLTNYGIQLHLTEAVTINVSETHLVAASDVLPQHLQDGRLMISAGDVGLINTDEELVVAAQESVTFPDTQGIHADDTALVELTEPFRTILADTQLSISLGDELALPVDESVVIQQTLDAIAETLRTEVVEAADIFGFTPPTELFTISATDTCKIQVKIQPFNLQSKTAAETLPLHLVEPPDLGRSLGPLDAVALQLTEVTALAINGAAVIIKGVTDAIPLTVVEPATDTAFSVIEQPLLALSDPTPIVAFGTQRIVPAADSCAIQASEVAAQTFADKQPTDTLAVGLTETATIEAVVHVALSATETMVLVLSETATIEITGPIAIATVSDSVPLVGSDAGNSNQAFTLRDDTYLLLDDQLSRPFLAWVTNDPARVAAIEALTVAATVSATETLQTPSADESVINILNAFEFLFVSDSAAVRTTDTAAQLDLLIEKVATDSARIVAADVAEPILQTLFQLSTTDSARVQVTEAIQFTQAFTIQDAIEEHLDEQFANFTAFATVDSNALSPLEALVLARAMLVPDALVVPVEDTAFPTYGYEAADDCVIQSDESLIGFESEVAMEDAVALVDDDATEHAEILFQAVFVEDAVAYVVASEDANRITGGIIVFSTVDDSCAVQLEETDLYQIGAGYFADDELLLSLVDAASIEELALPELYTELVGVSYKEYPIPSSYRSNEQPKWGA